MKSLWMAAITAAALTATASPAWQTSGSAGQSALNSSSPNLAGTDVVAELSKSVDVKKVKLGDPVKAQVMQDVLSHGSIVIRRGTKLVGHITEVKVRNQDDQESRLGVIFDKALLKHGEEIDFSAGIRALAPAVRIGAVDRPDAMPPPMVGPMQSSGPQPMGSGTATTRGASTSSSVSPSGPTSDNAATRTELYSKAAGYGGVNSETGLISAGSRGVFGMPALHINLDPKVAGSIISSTSKNVKLDSGTQMVIQVGNQSR